MKLRRATAPHNKRFMTKSGLPRPFKTKAPTDKKFQQPRIAKIKDTTTTTTTAGGGAGTSGAGGSGNVRSGVGGAAVGTAGAGAKKSSSRAKISTTGTGTGTTGMFSRVFASTAKATAAAGTVYRPKADTEDTSRRRSE
jgi:hypothetical protein